MNIGKPDSTEYAPYYGKYVSLVPDGDIITQLRQQFTETTELLRAVSEQQANARYAPGKWSIKEVVGHLIDAERVFAYRVLRFSRGDTRPLAGFDQDPYVASAAFDRYPLSELVAELECVRESTLYLLNRLDADAWERRGIASENEVSVRGLAYIIAGHELHHRQILRDKYLNE